MSIQIQVIINIVNLCIRVFMNSFTQLWLIDRSLSCFPNSCCWHLSSLILAGHILLSLLSCIFKSMFSLLTLQENGFLGWGPTNVLATITLSWVMLAGGAGVYIFPNYIKSKTELMKSAYTLICGWHHQLYYLNSITLKEKTHWKLTKAQHRSHFLLVWWISSLIISKDCGATCNFDPSFLFSNRWSVLHPQESR